MSGQTLISIAEVSRRVGLSSREVYRRMRDGEFPQARNLGPRCTRWVSAEIDAWIEALPLISGGPEAETTAAEAPPSERRPTLVR